jgi:hypothetical protein
MTLRAIILLVAQFAFSESVGSQPVSPEIVVNERSRELEGWFSARGEWTLFPSEDIDAYDPFDPEGRKCVSLVNATTKRRAEYAVFDHKRVLVVGAAIRYDALASGTSTADRLLSKKYFGEELVENSCLRDFVFVVRDIQLSPGEE